MALLAPHTRPRMRHEECVEDRRAADTWLGGVELDAGEVLGADVAVLIGTDEADRCAVIAIEVIAVETVSQEHGLVERVVDREDGSPSVQSAECDVAHDGAGRQPWRDRLAVDRGERHASPSQVRCGPAGDTMEVGDDLASVGAEELGHLHGERLDPDPAELDDGPLRGNRRGAGERLAEARKSLERPLTRGQCAHGACRWAAVDASTRARSMSATAAVAAAHDTSERSPGAATWSLTR